MHFPVKILNYGFSMYIVLPINLQKLEKLKNTANNFLISIMGGQEALSYVKDLYNFIMFQILDIDRILHEQQLGLEWTCPDLSQLYQEDLSSHRSAMQVVADLFPKKGEIKNCCLLQLGVTTVGYQCFKGTCCLQLQDRE
jgi:hypothetical protein